MVKLETSYLGLTLKNPVIVSSSGLSNSIEKIEKLAEAGAGAIVLKSIFEEQINMEAGSMLSNTDYPEATDYITNYAKSNALDTYLDLIEKSKKATDIPILASINCTTANEWVSFAKSMQDAGADALELNVYYLPKSIHESSAEVEDLYVNVLTSVKKKLSVPVVMKLGQQFTNLPSLVNRLKANGASGVVLFNRFYAPDINTDNLSFNTSEVLSQPADIRFPLRWVGIISSLVANIDLCASTGIHDGKAVVKQLLAGATAVQVCSAIYKNGPSYLQTIIGELEKWMEEHNFEEIRELKGRLSYKNIPDPGIFERAQFMKYFSSMV